LCTSHTGHRRGCTADSIEVDKSGQLSDAGADEVAIYDFSVNWPQFGGIPGSGNTILAGKVDDGSRECRGGTLPPPCTAVFWDLSKLNSGDEIQIFWDRKAHVYRVGSKCYLDIQAYQEFVKVIEKTESETLTLVTSAGLPPSPPRGYSHRLLMRVSKVQGAASQDCVVRSATLSVTLPTQPLLDVRILPFANQGRRIRPRRSDWQFVGLGPDRQGG